MSRRANLYALLVVLGAVLAVPTSSVAASGGTGVPSGTGTSGNAGQSSTGQSGTGQSGTGQSGAAQSGSVLGPSVQAGNLPVTSSAAGITLNSSASALFRNQLSFSGTAPHSDAGQTVEIERLGHQTNWQWTPTVQATIGSDGSFSAAWHTDHIGRFSIRAVIGSQTTASATSASAAPTVTITVYRVAIATQYGPGFYGQRTACGSKLRPSTIGVANRTLKCGTQVAIYWRGKTMVVPVIDRGPYANNADWDLTEATGRALGINGTASIGAVSLPPQP